MAKRRSTGPGISFFAFQDIITAVVGIFILITLILVLQLAQRVEAGSESVPQDIQPIVATIKSLQQQVRDLEAEMAQRAAASSRTEDINAFNIAEKVERLKSENAGSTGRIETSLKNRSELEKLKYVAISESEKLATQSISLSEQRQELSELNEEVRKMQAQRNAVQGEQSTLFRDQTEQGRYVVLVTLSPESIEIQDGLTRNKEKLSGAEKLERWNLWLAKIPLSRRHLLLRIQPGGERDFQAIKAAADAAGAEYGFTVVGSDDAARFGHDLRVSR